MIIMEHIGTSKVKSARYTNNQQLF